VKARSLRHLLLMCVQMCMHVWGLLDLPVVRATADISAGPSFSFDPVPCLDARDLRVRVPQVVAEAVIARLPEFSTQGIGNVSWGFSAVGHYHKDMYSLIAREIPPHLAEFLPQELSNVLLGFARFGHLDPSLLKVRNAGACRASGSLSAYPRSCPCPVRRIHRWVTHCPNLTLSNHFMPVGLTYLLIFQSHAGDWALCGLVKPAQPD